MKVGLWMLAALSLVGCVTEMDVPTDDVGVQQHAAIWRPDASNCDEDAYLTCFHDCTMGCPGSAPWSECRNGCINYCLNLTCAQAWE